MGDMRNIIVVPYDPQWATMFEAEATRLAKIFGSDLIAIHHVGSTSVPNLSAKPVIDMMPVVHDIRAVARFNPVMEAHGYEPKGENAIPGRRYFVKGGDAHRTHHVHTYEPDHPEVARHLDFRDYLIAHPDEAEQYARLKRALAKKFPHDIFGYMAGKDAFIKKMLQKAQEWRARKPFMEA